ncbi:MAG: hypothetical protein JO300_04910 [Silvibacterium sp.]|nr:hypothetical protein [Silvibacterium sp.]MBV8437545.1 hypothetical protein [Silvibacterium sp.]
MRKSIPVISLLILVSFSLFAMPLRAQEAKTSESKASETKTQPDAHYYHLEFVLKELGDDGRVVNSRTYHTSVSTDGRSSLMRTGTKVPVRTNDKDMAYLDVGVNLDCGSARETPQGLGVQITAEISSLANPSGGTPEAGNPLLRQNKWSSMTVLPIGKPTIVFSSDNLENKGRMQLEVTVTPIR